MFTFDSGDAMSLRLPTRRDAAALALAIEQDLEHVAAWQDWPRRIRSVADAEAFIVGLRQAFAAETALPCFLMVGEQVAGLFQLSKVDLYLGKAWLDYWLGASHTQRGLATRACRALLAHGFEELELHRVAIHFKSAGPSRENTASRRMAERLGFSEEGVRRSAGLTRGERMDMVVYSMLRPEWQQRLSTPTASPQ